MSFLKQLIKTLVNIIAELKTSRTPIYPADWKNQFGLPIEEHQKLLQVNIFEGYTVFSVQDKKPTDEVAEKEKVAEGGET